MIICQQRRQPSWAAAIRKVRNGLRLVGEGCGRAYGWLGDNFLQFLFIVILAETIQSDERLALTPALSPRERE
jgi:hypothetical protein